MAFGEIYLTLRTGVRLRRSLEFEASYATRYQEQ